MAGPSAISVKQFLDCLKQQGPVSSQIKAAGQVDVSSDSEIDAVWLVVVDVLSGAFGRIGY